MPPETCPNCGADVPPKAKACPECGACDQTGWSGQAAYDALDLPDKSFDYGEFVRHEFGGEEPGHKRFPWYWWAAAILALGGFLLFVLR